MVAFARSPTGRFKLRGNKPVKFMIYSSISALLSWNSCAAVALELRVTTCNDRFTPKARIECAYQDPVSIVVKNCTTFVPLIF
jgi:hypothetical protein